MEKIQILPLPKRSEEEHAIDRLNAARSLAVADLIKAGADWYGETLLVSETVQGRIKKVGDAAYAVIEFENEDQISIRIWEWLAMEFGERLFEELDRPHFVKMVAKLKELGMMETVANRRIPQAIGQKGSWISFPVQSYQGFVKEAVTAFKNGALRKKEEAMQRFEEGKFVFDKTLD